MVTRFKATLSDRYRVPIRQARTSISSRGLKPRASIAVRGQGQNGHPADIFRLESRRYDNPNH